MAETEDGAPIVGLDTLIRGAIVERFNDALADVLANIVDLNTDDEAMRGIVMRVKLKPGDDRTRVIFAVSVETKLAPARPIGTVLYVGVKDGRPVAREFNPKQLHFDDVPKSGLRPGETVTLTSVPKAK